jgi:hypothetical protein
VTGDKTTVNEGQTITFTVTVWNLPLNTTMYWKNIGTSVAADFVENISQGTFQLTEQSPVQGMEYQRTGYFTLTVASDAQAEFSETIQIEIRQTVDGDVLKTSSVYTINGSGYNEDIELLITGAGSTKYLNVQYLTATSNPSTYGALTINLLYTNSGNTSNITGQIQHNNLATYSNILSPTIYLGDSNTQDTVRITVTFQGQNGLITKVQEVPLYY